MAEKTQTQKCTFTIETPLYNKFREISLAIGYTPHHVSRAVMKAMGQFITRYEGKLDDIRDKVAEIERLREELENIIDDTELKEL